MIQPHMTRVHATLGDEHGIIAGRYRLISRLGRGGMGDIYLVEDTLLGNERLALKVLKEELSEDEMHAKRFLREVQLTRKVSHPHVVRTFDIGTDGPRLFFTMEFVEGKTLKQFLGTDPTPWRDAAGFLLQICEGLAAIHHCGIIHRDLKLSNVMVTLQGTLKIADFGVARAGYSTLTARDEVVGSATHISPEGWRQGETSIASDIYALGVLTYEMLTGVLPFDGASAAEIMWKHLEATPVAPSEICQEIPPEIDSLVISMLAKDPKDRPFSCEDISSYLVDLLAHAGPIIPRTAREVEEEHALDIHLTDLLPTRGEEIPQSQVDPISVASGVADPTPRVFLPHLGSIAIPVVLSVGMVLGLMWGASSVGPGLAGVLSLLLGGPALLALIPSLMIARVRGPSGALRATATCFFSMLVFSWLATGINIGRMMISTGVYDLAPTLGAVVHGTQLQLATVALLLPPDLTLAISDVGKARFLAVTEHSVGHGIWGFHTLMLAVAYVALVLFLIRRHAYPRRQGAAFPTLSITGFSAGVLALSMVVAPSRPALLEVPLNGAHLSLTGWDLAVSGFMWCGLLALSWFFRRA